MRQKLALTSIVAAVAISSAVSAQPRSALANGSSAVAGAGQTVQESTDANQGPASSQEVDATLATPTNSQDDSGPAVNQAESADNASTEPDQNTPGTSEQPAAPAKNGWESTASGWVFWIDGEQAHGIVSVEGKSYFLDAKTGIMATGWKWDEAESCWYYAEPSGTLATGWCNIKGSWYWLDPESFKMATGVIEVGGTRYAMTPSGAMATGWALVDGTWYYAAPSGALASGWQAIGGSWYWLDPETCKMATGWLTQGDAKYYLTPSGAMATGWCAVDSAWHWFDVSGNMTTGWLNQSGTWYWLDDDGKMVTGVQKVGNTAYCFRASGAMATGWALDSDNWYWGDNSGALATSDWRFVNGSWYWFDDESKMATGLKDINGKRYFFSPDGAMKTGWVLDNGDWYWLQGSGEAKTGWLYDGGLWYWLGSDGKMLSNAWYDNGSRSYYLSASGAMVQSDWIKEEDGWYWVGTDGSSVEGWNDLPSGRFYFDSVEGSTKHPALLGHVTIDDKHFFISETTGLARSAWIELDDGSAVFAGSDGAIDDSVVRKGGILYLNGEIAEGWISIDGVRFHTDSEGHLSEGWFSEEGTWYYAEGGVVQTGWKKLKDTWYYLESDGKMATGWKLVRGNWYYLETSGAMHTGWLNDDGSWYYLGGSGAMYTGTHAIDGYYRRFDSSGRCDKVGYQNPAGYYQVSSWNVSPTRPGMGAFSYVTPSKIGVNATRSDCVEAFISRAYDYLGTPYIWDYACAPGVGVDCAGLVMQCLYATGMDVSPMNPYDHYNTPGHDHYANDMWNNYRFQHLGIGDRQRGDIVCWPGHVAIYLGNDQVLEAYNPSVGVRITGMYNWGSVRGVLRPFM